MYQNQGMDFNDAGQQQVGELIPAGTIAKVVITIRPGSAGQGGWLTRSNTSDVEYLNCEFTILEGSFAKRKFWQNPAHVGRAGKAGHARGVIKKASQLHPPIICSFGEISAKSLRNMEPDSERKVGFDREKRA